MEEKATRKYLESSVLEEAQKRISFVFDRMKNICVSFSGGKDSTVLTHLVLDEAKKRDRKVGLFFLDWEAQFELTISHIDEIYKKYSDNIIPYWVALPITTTNGCSMYEPEWTCWEESKKDLWIRDKHELSIKDKKYFPFYYEGMTFEEFVPLFSKWFSNNEDTGFFVGIRTQESLNRYRAVSYNYEKNYDNTMWSTNVVDNVWNFYPIYDWNTRDIWIYNAKMKKVYNTLYDRMYKAGLSVHQMRIDEPFGETQRKGLWLYQVVEPKTWAKMCCRVAGANSGSLYSKSKGNVLGNRSITLPKNHTWESFANLILNTMPAKTSEHYKNKITVYLKWYRERGYPDGIPQEADNVLEQLNKVPSWKMITKALLRNDYWCIGLGFSPTKKDAYDKYMELMKRRRKNWGIFNDTAN